MPKGDSGVKDKKEQAAALLERGNSEYLWEDMESSIHQYENAFRLSASVDWQEGMIRSLIAISRSSDAMGMGEQSKLSLQRAEYLLSENTDTALLLSAANRRTEWLLFNSSPAEALRESNGLIASADKSPGREAGEAWRIRAAILKRQREYVRALESADHALALDKKRGYLRESASDHYIRSSILSLSGKADQAAEAMHSALALDKQIENTPGIAQDLYALGLIYEKAGNDKKAEYYFRRAALVYEAAGFLTLPEGLSLKLDENPGSHLWIDTEEL